MPAFSAANRLIITTEMIKKEINAKYFFNVWFMASVFLNYKIQVSGIFSAKRDELVKSRPDG